MNPGTGKKANFTFSKADKGASNPFQKNQLAITRPFTSGQKDTKIIEKKQFQFNQRDAHSQSLEKQHFKTPFPKQIETPLKKLNAFSINKSSNALVSRRPASSSFIPVPNPSSDDSPQSSPYQRQEHDDDQEMHLQSPKQAYQNDLVEFPEMMTNVFQQYQKTKLAQDQKILELLAAADSSKITIHSQTEMIEKMQKNTLIVVTAMVAQGARMDSHRKRMDKMKETCDVYRASIKKIGTIIDNVELERVKLVEKCELYKSELVSLRLDKTNLSSTVATRDAQIKAATDGYDVGIKSQQDTLAKIELELAELKNTRTLEIAKHESIVKEMQDKFDIKIEKFQATIQNQLNDFSNSKETFKRDSESAANGFKEELRLLKAIGDDAKSKLDEMSIAYNDIKQKHIEVEARRASLDADYISLEKVMMEIGNIVSPDSRFAIDNVKNLVQAALTSLKEHGAKSDSDFKAIIEEKNALLKISNESYIYINLVPLNTLKRLKYLNNNYLKPSKRKRIFQLKLKHQRMI